MIDLDLLTRIAELETENWLLRRELTKEYRSLPCALSLPRRQAMVLRTLLDFSPRWVTKEQLCARVYCDHLAIERPETTIESHMSHLRKNLRAVGVEIISKRFTGYAITKRDAELIEAMGAA